MAANEEIANSFIRHAVDLERFGTTERRKALRLLKTLEDDLVTLVAQGAGTDWTKARLRALLLQVQDTIGSAYEKMREKIVADMQSLAEVEMSFAADAANGAIGADITTVEFDANLLRAVVSEAVIQGGPQADWWDRQANKTEQLFGDTVRLGILSGDTTDTIVRTLRRNVMQGSIRRNVEALVRTSVASVAADARQQFYDQNEDVIEAVQQHSTLDARTTLICMAYSGKRWSLPDYEPIDHNLPFINEGGSPNGTPRHWNCRSVIVPVVLAFDQLGSRMGKKDTARAERSFEKKLKTMGMDDEEIARARMGAQASMTGTVPETWTYEDWLEAQPEEVQRQALGARRWERWRDGRIKTFSELVDQSGNPLTLKELAGGENEAA
jgi:hypothetical protein